MSFVCLRDLTARVIMRSAIENFLVELATVLAIPLDEARDLARGVLNETRQSDDGERS